MKLGIFTALFCWVIEAVEFATGNYGKPAHTHLDWIEQPDRLRELRAKLDDAGLAIPLSQLRHRRLASRLSQDSAMAVGAEGVPFWRERACFAREHGVRIALEMHPGFVVYSPETLLRLRAEAGPEIGCKTLAFMNRMRVWMAYSIPSPIATRLIGHGFSVRWVMCPASSPSSTKTA